MHIMDGIVSPPLIASVTLVAAGAVVFGLKRVSPDDIPKIALLAAAFFVIGVLRVPIGPTAAHLMMSGILGLILGAAIFPAILAGLLLQTLIFGFGGITVIGLNLLNMALPGYLAYLLFSPLLHKELTASGAGHAGHSLATFGKLNQNTRLFLIGFFAGGLALCGSVLMVAFSLVLSGQEFAPLAQFMALANLPIVLVEGLVAGFMLRFLVQLKPELFSTPQNSTLARPALPAEL